MTSVSRWLSVGQRKVMQGHVSPSNLNIISTTLSPFTRWKIESGYTLALHCIWWCEKIVSISCWPSTIMFPLVVREMWDFYFRSLEYMIIINVQNRSIFLHVIVNNWHKIFLCPLLCHPNHFLLMLWRWYMLITAIDICQPKP